MGNDKGGASRVGRTIPQYRTFADYDAAKNFMDGNYRGRLDDINYNSRYALERYTTGDGYDINDYLRNGDAGYDHGESAQLVKGMDAAFALPAAVLQHNITVTRGFGEKTDWIKQLAVGDVFTDNGFISTAVKPIPETNTYRVVIQVPAKTRGLWLEPLTTHEGEYELLLDRGTSFRVTSRNTETGIPTLTVIGQRKR